LAAVLVIAVAIPAFGSGGGGTFRDRVLRVAPRL
jgi:hypothetical protein